MAKIRTRLKKLLAVTLALSLTMSLLNFTAFADGGDSPLTVEVGASLTLEDKDGTTGEPEVVEAVEETSWTSGDDTVATVVDGVVTGVSAGSVEITRTSYGYLWTDPEDSANHEYYDYEDITNENETDISPVKVTTSWSVTVTSDSASETEVPVHDDIVTTCVGSLHVMYQGASSVAITSNY